MVIKPSLWPKCVRWESVTDLPHPGRPYTTNLYTICTVLYCSVLHCNVLYCTVLHAFPRYDSNNIVLIEDNGNPTGNR